MGFFTPTELLSSAPVNELVPQCGPCGLYKRCNSPKMEPSGKGRKKILIVGEAPGKDEDKEGIQFIGESGQLLQRMLESVDIDMRRDCRITNAAICRPEGNLLPDKAIGYCRANVLNTIKEFDPNAIILLGGSAVKSVIGWLWREDVGPVGRWAGWQIPSQKVNAWICPTWHPAFFVRGGGGSDGIMEKMFARHLRRAARKAREKPWQEIPDYKSRVEIQIDADKASEKICKFTDSPLVTFDYETTTLKPDGDRSVIFSCSMSDGKKTIAYPWSSRTREATWSILKNPAIAKIASNMKFEERWTRKEFGKGVRNWEWDTMLAAHLIDNRPHISSIKFQSFILLGQESYDDHIKPFFKSSNANVPNRINQVDWPSLLLYNGLDSLLEFEVAKIQMRRIR